MTKKIEKTANEFQALDRQIKDLQAKQKPLKKELVTYAEKHKSEFDEAFQLKFPNGTYISQRVSDVIEGSKDAKAQLLEESSDDFKKISLDEKLVLAEAPKDSRLRKLLTKLGLKVSQKETFAVYAG